MNQAAEDIRRRDQQLIRRLIEISADLLSLAADLQSSALVPADCGRILQDHDPDE